MDFKTVLAAYKKCAKGKRKSLHCAKFESNLGKEILELTNEINNKTYRPEVSRCFVVLKPKPREIWAAHFRDRVVHHIIVDALEAVYEKSYSSKTYACRKTKGLHACLQEFKNQVRRTSQGGRKNVWVLKVDIESFFVSISCDPRKNYIVSGYRENLKKVNPSKSWFNYPPGKGIPIGNLTSQFGANFYLSGLDHFIQRKLKPRGYLRYMDDLLFISDSQQSLSDLENQVDEWLSENRLQNLNRSKTKLVNLRNGMNYLGCYVQQVDSPKEPLLILPNRKKSWDLVKSLNSIQSWNWNRMHFNHELSFANRSIHRTKLSSVNSRLGILKTFKSFELRRNAVQNYFTITDHEDLSVICTDSIFGKVRYNG